MYRRFECASFIFKIKRTTKISKVSCHILGYVRFPIDTEKANFINHGEK